MCEYGLIAIVGGNNTKVFHQQVPLFWYIVGGGGRPFSQGGIAFITQPSSSIFVGLLLQNTLFFFFLVCCFSSVYTQLSLASKPFFTAFNH